MDPVTATLASDLVLKALGSGTWKQLSSLLEKKLLTSHGARQSEDEKIAKIAGWYRSGMLVPVLGAGASAAYGLPTWSTLLQKLLLLTLKPSSPEPDEKSHQAAAEKAGVLARTFTSIFEPSPIVSARYLHNHFRLQNPNSKLAFENAIRSALYDGIKPGADSDLLREIRQYCIAAGKSPNIDCIITYNYDDILERTLANIDLDIPFTPIHASGMRPRPDSLPIYHVHGFLPREGTLTQKNRVVLSEDGYHQQYSDTYGWSNLVQINKFKDNNCLFVGISFTDPNLRRLLDIAKNERGDTDVHHFCFRRRYDRAEIQRRLERLLSENAEIMDQKRRAQLELEHVVTELVQLIESVDENDALSFGVGLLWVDDYADIPSILKRIRTRVD